MPLKNVIPILAALLFLGIICFLFSLNDQSKKPKLKNGKITFSLEDLDNITLLDGEVKFYWDQFITYSDYINKNYSGKEIMIHTRKKWHNLKINQQTLPKYGYGSYVFNIDFKNISAAEEIKLEIVPFTTSPLEIEINGEVVVTRGVLGKNRASAIPSGKDISFNFYPGSRDLTFIIRVAEFNISSNGYFPKINLGQVKKIDNSKNLRTFFDIFIASFMFIAILNSLLFYIFLKKKYILNLAFLFMTILPLKLISGEKVIYNFTSTDFFLTFLRFGDAIFVLFFIFLNSTLYFFLKGFYNKKIFFISTTIYSLIIITYFFLPTYINSGLFSVFSILFLLQSFYLLYIIGQAVRKKIDGSLILFITNLMLIILSFNDLLLYQDIDNIPTILEDYNSYRPFFFYILFPLLLFFTFFIIKEFYYFQEIQKKLLKIFSKFVPRTPFLNKNITNIQLAKNAKKKMFVAFFDIVGFTNISEKIKYEFLLESLNEYYDFIYNFIKEKNGIVNKFIGDGVLVIFPSNKKKIAIQCEEVVENCLLIFEKIKELNQLKRKNIFLKNLKIRLMLNYSEVHIANIGSINRMDTAILGSAFDDIFQMEKIAKKHNSDFVFSDSLKKNLKTKKWDSKIKPILKSKKKSAKKEPRQEPMTWQMQLPNK